MSHEGNTWLKLWSQAASCAAAKQKPVFDVIVEGEKALHFLETAPASIVFETTARCAFTAILALFASTDCVKKRPESAASEALKVALDASSSYFSRESSMSPEDYDCAVYALQLCERRVAREFSLRIKFPDAPDALIDRLLPIASRARPRVRLEWHSTNRTRRTVNGRVAGAGFHRLVSTRATSRVAPRLDLRTNTTQMYRPRHRSRPVGQLYVTRARRL
jgi:hypothetical protein